MSYRYTALRHVFKFLPMSDLLRASQVCHLWRDIAFSSALVSQKNRYLRMLYLTYARLFWNWPAQTSDMMLTNFTVSFEIIIVVFSGMKWRLPMLALKIGACLWKFLDAEQLDTLHYLKLLRTNWLKFFLTFLLLKASISPWPCESIKC